MKKLFCISILSFLIGCGEGPSKDEFREIRVTDNHSSYVEIRDNYTNIQTTSVTTTTNDTSSSSTTTSEGGSTASTSTESTPTIQMFNDVVYSMTSVNYALGNMPILTFYVEGDSKRYAMNQNGVQPGVDNFSESETGFFNYTILKSELELIGADVNVDNTSDITLNYKTNLYGFVQNKEKTMIYNMAPIEYLIKVK